MLEDSASKSEEGSGGEEGDVFEGQQELLQKGLALHQIVRLVRKVDFCIHLPNDEQGAENGRDKERATTHPQVEEQEKLEGCFRFELGHHHSVGRLFHLWRVNKDGKSFRDDHQYADKDCRISEQERIPPEGIDHGKGQRDAQRKVCNENNAASVAG